MNILFDQGTPVPLRDALAGHLVETAFERGWSRLDNGDLLVEAERASFDILVTTDQNLRSQQNPTTRRLAVLVLPTTRWPTIQRHAADIVNAIESIQPGHRAFDVMRRASWHEYQILTKRSDRLLSLDPFLFWEPHIWMGVSVENARFQHRIDHLRETGARVKFLSLEPLLGPLPRLDLRGIDWVIVGGESGPRARPMNVSWVLDIRDQCRSAGVAFFFKQWGGVFKSRTGRELEGRTWDEMPDERRTSVLLRLIEPGTSFTTC